MLPSRSATILAAIAQALARQALSIDANTDLATLTLVVELGRGSGPDSCQVLCRQEARRTVRGG